MSRKGWFRPALARKAKAVLSTGCNAVSPRQYIHRADDISVFLVSTVHTHKLGLGLSILCGNVAAGQTGLAGVMHRYGHEYSASPIELVSQLAAKLELALIKNGFAWPRLDGYVFTRCFGRALARLGHIFHLQILNCKV